MSLPDLPNKQKLREKLKKDIEEFLKNGGKIIKLPDYEEKQ